MIIRESIEGIKEFDNLPIGEKFTYVVHSYEFEAIKIRDDQAAFINACGKYINAHRFNNCLSIGSHSIEYNTLEDLMNALPNYTPDYGYINNSRNEIKELRSLTGLSQAAFAERFNIPVRTIENWESGKRTPPEYVVSLLEYRIQNEAK